MTIMILGLLQLPLSILIFQVTKYILVMEGIPQMEKYLPNESFSCRSFFQSISLERDLRIAIFVYFHYRNATCKNLPLYSRVDSGYDIEIFESGTYHLLQVTHKFPMLQKVKSSIFSSHGPLYYDLYLGGGHSFPTMSFEGHHFTFVTYQILMKISCSFICIFLVPRQTFGTKHIKHVRRGCSLFLEFISYRKR